MEMDPFSYISHLDIDTCLGLYKVKCEYSFILSSKVWASLFCLQRQHRPKEQEGAFDSEKRRFSSFLLRTTLYIDVETHFMRLVIFLCVCIDVRARMTHL
jgi:hypothetical protein